MIQLISPNFADLMEPNIEIGKFPDGDSHVHIPQLPDCRGKDITFFHRLYPNQNDCLIELLLILQTLREQGAGKLTVVAPYLPYARQDKKTMDGEVQSAHIICDLIRKAGCDQLISFDCHFLNAEGETVFGNLPIRNISLASLLVAEAKKFFGGEEFEVVGPDDGAKYLVAAWGGKTMQKRRAAYVDGKVGYRPLETLECEFDVKDKNVLLIDDMISTGNTVIAAAGKLRACGAKKICVAATHGLFLYNCLDKIRKTADEVFATDTIVSPQGQVSIKETLAELLPAAPRLF